MAHTDSLPPRPSQRRPELLWLSISHVANTILDSTLRRFLFTQASKVVVLNGELAGYGDLVQAIKLEFPSIKVLRYTNAQRIPAGTRVASTMYCHFLDHVYTQALQLRTGVPKVHGDGMIFTDITNPNTRNFIVSHLVEQVAAHGVDGVAIDSFHADLMDWVDYVDGEQKAAQWPGACREILEALQVALPGREIWFNGLWAFDQQKLDAQEALLEWADGASVEFYGYDGRPEPQVASNDSFGTFVGPVNEVLARHPTKPILVRGTATGDDYYDYKTSLRQARYCYGCYLVGWTPGSAFSFGQDFQLTRLLVHRHGGAAMFSYFELALGNPAGPAVDNQTGGWSRVFSEGAVFVAEASAISAGTQTWLSPTDLWTTLGKRVLKGTSIKLNPGNATILLRRRPEPPPAELHVDLPRSANDHLVEGATGEWLVQGVTGEYHYLRMILTVNSTDSASAVLVRFETDDTANPPRRPFGILTILPEVTTETFDPGHSDYPSGQLPTGGAVQVTCSHRYPTNGSSDAITIDFTTECDPYTCFRVISVRAIGTVVVEGIRLARRSPIPGV